MQGWTRTVPPHIEGYKLACYFEDVPASCDAARTKGQSFWEDVPMETVLVVEDSRVMQRTLRRLFEADSLDVSIASDAQEGLEYFRKQPPSAVILDLKLPGMS